PDLVDCVVNRCVWPGRFVLCFGIVKEHFGIPVKHIILSAHIIPWRRIWIQLLLLVVSRVTDVGISRQINLVGPVGVGKREVYTGINDILLWHPIQFVRCPIVYDKVVKTLFPAHIGAMWIIAGRRIRYLLPYFYTQFINVLFCSIVVDSCQVLTEHIRGSTTPLKIV